MGKPPFETSCLKETYIRIKKNDYVIPRVSCGILYNCGNSCALVPPHFTLVPPHFALVLPPFALVQPPFALVPPPFALVLPPFALVPPPFALVPPPFALVPPHFALLPPQHISPVAAALIKKMLHADPTLRPTIGDLLTDEFFTCGYIPLRLPTTCLTVPPRFSIAPSSLEASQRRPLTALNKGTSVHTPRPVLLASVAFFAD